MVSIPENFFFFVCGQISFGDLIPPSPELWIRVCGTSISLSCHVDGALLVLSCPGSSIALPWAQAASGHQEQGSGNRPTCVPAAKRYSVCQETKKH